MVHKKLDRDVVIHPTPIFTANTLGNVSHKSDKKLDKYERRLIQLFFNQFFDFTMISSSPCSFNDLAN